MKRRRVRRRRGRSPGPVRAATFAIAALLAAAGPILAAPYAHFEPGELIVTPSEEFDVSFRLAESADSIASFQLYLSFDPEMIELVEAVEGSLYAESGCMTWFVHEEIESGFHHFFDTLFGAGTYVEPPGEILHLRFRALEVCGGSPLHADTLRFTDVRRDALPPGGFEDGQVFVACSGAAELPVGSVSFGPASPNPFRSGTELPFALSRPADRVSVRVYDAAGRCVRAIDVLGGTPRGAVRWDGRNGDGHPLPSGVYFVEMDADGERARTTAVRIR